MKNPTPTPSSLIWGKNALLEALRARTSIEKIYLAQQLRGDFEKHIRQWAREHATPLVRVPRQKLQKLAGPHHQGVVAVVSPVRFYTLDEALQKAPSSTGIVMLDRVTDVRNWGAIARSALAFGVYILITPTKHSAEINAATIKASAGALFQQYVVRVHNLVALAQELKEMGYHILCADKNAATTELSELSPPPKWCLVVGSEHRGIRKELLNLADEIFYIDQRDAIDSLNVSVATGIALYRLYKTISQR